MEVIVSASEKTVKYRYVCCWLQPGDSFPTINFAKRSNGQCRDRNYSATPASYRRLAGLVWDLSRDGHRLSVNQVELGWTLFFREVR